MKKLISIILTLFSLIGILTIEQIERSIILRHTVNYANDKKIPKNIETKIIKMDLSYKNGKDCSERCDT